MKIVIPMSGRGQRFLNRGYRDPKPLIQVDGQPIIAYVVGMFSPEDDFLFICAKDHLEETSMRDVLHSLTKKCEIVAIEPHKKGPVYAVQQTYDWIKNDEEVIVNYCDFGCYWDYADFLVHTRERRADGAIPAYRGFHPHMLGSTNYAFMREEKQWMTAIQEKQPFTDNRMEEFASSGTYYFRTGSIMKRFMDEAIARNLHVNGEYYVSLVYNLLLEAGLKVSIYEIQHMLQWGTPEDLEEYLYHSGYFSSLIQHRPFFSPLPGTINLIPLAGEGRRFREAGYETPKPLLPVSGKPMILQAFDSYPKGREDRFVVLQQHCEAYAIDRVLSDAYPGCRIIRLAEVTEGQALTASLGLTEDDAECPLLIAACDNGVLMNEKDWSALLEQNKADAVCLTFRNNPAVRANPKGYGYLVTDGNGRVTGVSVKTPISETPMNDHAIVAAFFFRRVATFLEGVEALVAANRRVNGEFYIDSLMGLLAEQGKRVFVFEVRYESWGTPNDYKTYRYWQSYFHKANTHPYTIQRDPQVPEEAIKNLLAEIYDFRQAYR